MFERIRRAAEKAASSAGTSRRGFLGHLGRAALGAAVAAGGVLAASGRTSAGQKNTLYSCQYGCRDKNAGVYYPYVTTSCGGCHDLPGCKLEYPGVPVGTC